MAKRRKSSTTRSIRTRRAAPMRMRSRSRSRSSKSGKVRVFQPEAMVYGAGRSPISTYVAPMLARFGFLGEVADEVGMGLVSYGLAKYTKGFTREVGMAGLTVENARVGEFAGQKALGAMNSNNNVTGDPFIYG